MLCTRECDTHPHHPHTHHPKQVILQHFYLRKDSVLSQYEVWKVDLEDAIGKARPDDNSIYLLRHYLRSLNKGMSTLKAELDKIKPEDFQPPPTTAEEEEEEEDEGGRG